MESDDRESAEECMRSIADADKQYVRPPVDKPYVPPVVESQKPPLILPSPEESWLTKERHIWPAMWRLSDRKQELVAVLACSTIVVLFIASLLSAFTPLWLQIAVGIFFLVNLGWKFLSDNDVSYTNFDRFCSAGDNTLLFLFGLGLIWVLTTFTPAWVWGALGMLVVLVLACSIFWPLVLFLVRSLGRAWRDQ
jgi:hypothetical protein